MEYHELHLGEGKERFMPTRSLLFGAGRYDLHHAIVYWGGYREVRLT